MVELVRGGQSLENVFLIALSEDLGDGLFEVGTNVGDQVEQRVEHAGAVGGRNVGRKLLANRRVDEEAPGAAGDVEATVLRSFHDQVEHVALENFL